LIIYKNRNMRRNIFLLLVLVIIFPALVSAESGENLWLRYGPVSESVIQDYSALNSIYVTGNSAVVGVAKDELVMAINGMTAGNVKLSKKASGSSV
jgi:alpha-glucuronidase